MRIHIYKNTKQLILFKLFGFLFVFASCNTNKYTDVTIQEVLILDVKKLNQEIEIFQKTVEETKDEQKLQQTFKSARLSYKNIEWAVEYFTPNPARFVNGPALDELEVAENTAIPPNGFQVIEELLFPHYTIENKNDLIRELRVLSGNIKQIQQHLEAITISNAHIMDALKMENNRILTLGITGFDSPIALHSIAEAKASLIALKFIISKMNYNDDKIVHYEKKISAIVDSAAKYCETNNDFNCFDRAYFILNYLNPISQQLVVFQRINKIENINRNTIVKPNVKTIFEKGAFDVNGFIPSDEYVFTNEKAVLGKKLFYENAFSNSRTRNCASCHNPEKAFTDELQSNKSLNGGNLNRNTPTLTYASLQNAQFWDMRQLDLEKQSLDVIQNKDEMHGNVANAIQILNKDIQYQKMFKKAFPTSNKIEEWQVQNALASYIRSLNAFDSKFDNYMRGESNTFSEEEILGFNLFAGKAKCATCHFVPLFNGTVPPSYQKTEQEVIGTPEDKKGKRISPDLGRYIQYQMPQLKNAFKTPSLRNVAVTAPYMHNGVYTTLEEVVDFYNNGGGVGLGLSVNNQTLPTDKLELNEKEIKALVAFMKTLTDKAYQ